MQILVAWVRFLARTHVNSHKVLYLKQLRWYKKDVLGNSKKQIVMTKLLQSKMHIRDWRKLSHVCARGKRQYSKIMSSGRQGTSVGVGGVWRAETPGHRWWEWDWSSHCGNGTEASRKNKNSVTIWSSDLGTLLKKMKSLARRAGWTPTFTAALATMAEVWQRPVSGTGCGWGMRSCETSTYMIRPWERRESRYLWQHR